MVMVSSLCMSNYPLTTYTFKFSCSQERPPHDCGHLTGKWSNLGKTRRVTFFFTFGHLAISLSPSHSSTTLFRNMQTPRDLAQIKGHEIVVTVLDEFIKGGGRSWNCISSFLPRFTWEWQHGYHWDKADEKFSEILNSAAKIIQSPYTFKSDISLNFCDGMCPKLQSLDFEKMEMTFQNSPPVCFRRVPEFRLPRHPPDYPPHSFTI
eukprot:TRINITY_DN5147_c0_g4_i3.p2 TRINITY_DN5147_c0_g4~~TRINITY_DN5147_c0_g4_i3.p2  ORF type:complete len:207 (-),score=35.43 TRINITY_DN5147_c0_g4_i3:94-714(-)